MTCPTCQRPAEWVSHETIYGKIYNPKAHMIWLCRDCMTWVGCHENTQKPKGTMADSATRKWRIRAHEAVDPLWQSGQFVRSEIYRRLAQRFGGEVHIGESDIQRCQDIIAAAGAMIGNTKSDTYHVQCKNPVQEL